MFTIIIKRMTMFTILLSISHMAMAEKPDLIPRALLEHVYHDCLQAHPDDKDHAVFCAKNTLDDVEQEIQYSYDVIDKKLSKKSARAQSDFEESHKQWEKTRDADCKYAEEKSLCLMQKSLDRMEYMHTLESE